MSDAGRAVTADSDEPAPPLTICCSHWNRADPASGPPRTLKSSHNANSGSRAMQVDISTELDCPLDEAITHGRTTDLLRFVAYPLVKFTPIEPQPWPDTWAEGTYWVGVHIFGFLPFGKQAIVISYPASGADFLLRDNGYSALVKVWDHTISISTINGRTRYRDTVTVHAGLFTLPVWLFAQVFYRHRQRRWRLLAGRGFRY